MEATCPCHRKWASSTAYYDHLVTEHHAHPHGAFILAQAALANLPLDFVVDDDGSIILAAVQLPLEEPVDAP